ncbi:MAG: N-acetylmuramoyl-L-alanine amidase [Firmicutes bacterium]|jgi:N-acetylmuramoyl-L-alanine amidase|nr:N-acetylmuramoyl-L-alanine amidase [Bacillota bacterium]MCL5993008.1 N-acetylmuramoyl-L-alanine amidase [Bacillota bacterium]
MKVTVFALQKTRRKLLHILTLISLLGAGIFLLTFFAWRQDAAVHVLRLSGHTIVLDPGHGGYDPGVQRDKLAEKVVALNIALVLRDYLQATGARVVMTRETDRDLLVLPTAGAKKQRDMQNRLKIITAADPTLLISIHVNAVRDSRWRGSQVFFKSGCEGAKLLAGMIQQELSLILANTNRQAQPGNYFILNEAQTPAVLVETGFISNPQEAGLLKQAEYQAKLAWAIYLAVIKYVEQLAT